MSDEVPIHAAGAVLRKWAFQQEYLARVAEDCRPIHVQLGRPPSLVFRVAEGAETVFLAWPGDSSRLNGAR